MACLDHGYDCLSCFTAYFTEENAFLSVVRSSYTKAVHEAEVDGKEE